MSAFVDPDFGVDREEGLRIAAAMGLTVRRPRRRRCDGPRFPLAPLLARHSLAELTRLIDVDRSTLYRWHRTGGVDAFVADELAIALGEHPATVWPEWASLTV